VSNENEPDRKLQTDAEQPDIPEKIETSIDEPEVLEEPQDIVEDAEIIEDEPTTEVEEPPVEEETEATPPPAPQIEKRKGGFLPAVLGGIVAGGIGYGVAWYQFDYLPDETSGQIVALQSQIDDLVEQAANRVDPQSLVETAIGSEISGLRSELEAQIAGLTDRLSEIEVAPRTDGTVATATFDEYRDEMIALRADVAAQEQRIQELAEQAAAELETARTQAIQESEQARETVAEAARRVAIAQVQTALEAGLPFGDLLPELEQATGAEIPNALSNAANGVATLAELQESFAPIARETLAVSRAEGVAGEDGGSFGGFLRNMFDVRSVEPREGDDVDAILSRAENAVRTGRISDALAEIDALPDLAQSTMITWTRQAKKRMAAVNTLNELSLNTAE
jgi:hypothetical protein